jgi:glycosyltransferase involved in cell wall biosynthesis
LTKANERGGHAPLVTIVLACGPDTEAAELSLRSIRAQTIQSFEVVVVDAGCPEAFLRTLNGPGAGDRIETIGGEGTADAWNAAAARSAARYICFLQPGDKIEETYLEKCLFYLEVAALDVCGSWQLRDTGLHRTGPFSLRALLTRNVSGSAVIRRETVIQAGGFDSAIAPPFLIWDLWIRMAEHGARGHLFPEPLVGSSEEAGDDPNDAAFVSQKYSHLLSDAGLVRRLDAIRNKKPPLNSYAGLLEGARQAEPPGIIVAMPFLSMGGAERAMAGLFRELSRCGFRVFLVTTGTSPPGCGDTSNWFHGNVAGLYQMPQFLAANLQAAFFSYLIQRHLIQVLLQVGAVPVYGWLPRLRELFGGLAVVDLLFNPVGHFDNHSENRELIDHVVVEHEGMAAWLVEHGERRARISVIPNAVDVDCFAPQAAREWRTGEPRREGTFVVGFFGRLAEEKAPDTFVRIAGRFKNRPGFQFLLCGTGPVETSLRSLCQEYGLEDTVHFLGFVKTTDYLPCCHVTVTCSRFDGRPNIVLESLAMGVPVVASRVGGIPEMAPEGHGAVLCEPDNVEEFCGAIERLASDKEGHLRLAAAGRQWVAGQYSLASAAGQYAKLFHDLSEAHPWPARSAEDEAAIAEAMLPASREDQPLPRGLLRAYLRIIGNALSWSNMAGTLKTVWLYTMLRRDRTTAREFEEFFDADHYALYYPDVKAAGVSLVWHYLLRGFRNGCNPSPLFDTDFYLGTHPDVAATGVNPLVHFIKWGRAEGRGSLPAEYSWNPAGDSALPKTARGAVVTSWADASISVVIPTKNAGAEFGEVLAALRRQPRSLEIVVVDSGSSDGTLDLARAHGARVVSIAPESFNHGETRNLGIRQAGGDFCIMLVQDAVPMGESWLEEMLSPFADERVVGVTARHVARPDSDAVARWQCDYRNRFLGDGARVQELESWEHFETLGSEERLRLASFDNVFSVLRRSFWEQCPFRAMSFAEDLDWGVRAISAGRRLVYKPSVWVMHSHTRPAVYYLRRKYVSGRIVPKILHLPPVETSARNDKEFLGLIGFLCGEARAILSEQGDWNELSRSYGAASGPLESLQVAVGLRELRPEYRLNEVREKFYVVLEQLLGPALTRVPRHEAAPVVVKALAEAVGAFAATYHNWCEARGSVSDGMRSLGAVLSKGV